MSLGFTSVVTEFPKYKILNEQESRVNVFHLAIRSLFRCHCVLCCCLLSRVSGMIVQSLSGSLVRKSTQLTVHPTHTVLILAGQGNSSLSSTFARQEKLINVTQTTRCAFPRHWFTSPNSISVSRDAFQGLVQAIRFQCRYCEKEIQFTCSFQISQCFLGTCQICKCR